MAWRNRLGVALLACQIPYACSAPPCRVDPSHDDKRYAAAAGCMVKLDSHMLVLRHLASGRLGVPAGFAKTKETAQCAAHRETWEETGLVVTVGPLLKQFGDQFYLYRCFPVRDDLKIQQEIPVPYTGRNEITAILWMDPHSIESQQWRFPWQFSEVVRLFEGLDQ